MIIGHQKQWHFLKEIAESGKIPHSFLFAGKSQLGKKTIALEFLKLIQGENFLEAQHPDLILVEPLEDKQTIHISQIRELNWKLSLKPYSAPFKSAIIDRAHLMGQDSQHALLKTLEEPKGKAILILIADSPELLFPTIISRCQIIKFYPVPQREIENYLKEKKLKAKLIEEIGRVSLGRPGRVIDLLSNSQKLENWQKTVREINKISASSLAARFQYAKELSQKNNLSETLEIWLYYFRDILISKINSQQTAINHYSLSKLRNTLQKIQTTNFLLSTTNVNPRLALEVLMLEF